MPGSRRMQTDGESWVSHAQDTDRGQAGRTGQEYLPIIRGLVIQKRFENGSDAFSVGSRQALVGKRCVTIVADWNSPLWSSIQNDVCVNFFSFGIQSLPSRFKPCLNTVQFLGGDNTDQEVLWGGMTMDESGVEFGLEERTSLQ